MQIGFVYIITTKIYEASNIYKIGCTKNIDKRLKTINATRLDNDKFYYVNLIQTFHYFKLEYNIHEILKSFRLNNEFFKCSIDIINKAITDYVNTNTFILHYDIIFEEAIKKKLKWYPETKCFSILDNKFIEILFHETKIIDELKSWINIVDKYNLYRFFNDSYFDEIIYFLKKHFYYDNDLEQIINKTYNMNLEIDSKNNKSNDLNTLFTNFKIN